MWAAAMAAAALAGADCPAASFEGFLAGFLDEVTVQRAFTADPLPTTAVETYDYESLITDRLVPLRALGFPLVPGRAERDLRRVRIEVSDVSTANPRASLAAPSGYRVVLEFQRDACWRLVRFDDQSQ